jgi:hypothetical protein
MSKVVKIEFVEELDNEPDYGYYEMPQGTTWTNYRIYRLTFEDGTDQYMRIGQIYDSYGSRSGFTDPQMVAPTEKTITVWEE